MNRRCETSVLLANDSGSVKRSQDYAVVSVSNEIPDIKTLAGNSEALFYPYLSEAVGGTIVEIPTGDWLQLQQHRVNAAATADAFMNYVDRSRMVSHIIPVSGVSGRNLRRNIF